MLQGAFWLINALVVPVWFLMIAVPRAQLTLRVVRSPWIVMPPILLYAGWLVPELRTVVTALARLDLTAVASLLGAPSGALVAWAHLLAFDLFAGRWLYLDARERGLPTPLVSALLLATFALAPLGLALYLLVRDAPFARARELLRAAHASSLAAMRLFWGSLGVTALSVALQHVDTRQVLGASTWLKPAKFGISIAIASLTLAFLLRVVSVTERQRGRIVGLFVGSLIVELLCIAIQSARGVASHFNYASFGDGALFVAMAVGSVVVTIALAELGWHAWRTRFEKPALGWGIRYGFAITVLGCIIAAFMPRPNADQLTSMRAGKMPAVIGAHSIGAVDGGAGLPVTQWSTEAGDLRVPHFIGLHALQVLPLVGLALGRGRRLQDALAIRLMNAIAFAYLGLVAATLLEAVRGLPLLAPDTVTLAFGGTWLAIGLVAALGARCPWAGRHVFPSFWRIA